MNQSAQLFLRYPIKPIVYSPFRISRMQSFLPVFLVLCVWIFARTHRIPALSLGAADPAVTVRDFLEKGHLAIQNSQWQYAEKWFDQALLYAEEPQKGEIHQLLEWSRANSMVESRHMDGSIRRYMETINPADSQKLLANIIQLIRKNYYGSLELNRIVPATLLQLQAYVGNSDRLCPSSSPLHDLYKQKEAIHSLPIQDLPQNVTDWNCFLALEENLRNLSDYNSLGDSWPAVELAYALSNSLDKYSYLLSPDQYRMMLDQLGGFYVGVGIDLVFEGEYPVIFDVVPRSSADVQGLQPGDLLLEAAGTDLHHLSSAQVKKVLAGDEGTSLSVTISRNGEKIRRSLTRELVDAPSVRYAKMLSQDIGYLRVANFDYDTALEMQKSIQMLEKNGADALILDLRSNGGGILTAAVDAAGLFIKEGILVTVHTAEEQTEYQAENHPFARFDLPLVVLVDKNTASAAEIFAAAMQDHHRAFLLGEKTFGKGVVQTIFQIPGSPAALCLTTACFLPPSGKSFHERGITPDILVKRPDNSTKNTFSNPSTSLAEDPVLCKGMYLLQREKENIQTASSFSR